MIHKHFSGYLMLWVIQYISLSGSTMQSDVCYLISVGMIGIARNKHMYTSICHNLTQTFSLLNQYKLHSNLWHRTFYLRIWNLWPQCVFLKVFSLIYYLCYVICIMHAFELRLNCVILQVLPWLRIVGDWSPKSRPLTQKSQYWRKTWR